MIWKILYSDGVEYKSADNRWDDLPHFNVIKITVENNGYSMIFSGWDVYCLEEYENEYRIIIWKDDDPEDPYYNQGQQRVIKSADRGFIANDIIYKPKSTWDNIPYVKRKRGTWVSDEKAKEFGIL